MKMSSATRRRMKSATRKTLGEPCFQPAFLGPRFWGTWGRLLLLRMAMHLPRKWVMAAGGFIGDQVRVRNKKRRRIAEINLEMCFPELSDLHRRQMLVDHFRQHGRGLLDMALAFWGSKARLDRLCRFERYEWLREMARRHPVIVITYHLTTMDMSGSILTPVHPSVSMMNRDRNPLLTWQLWKGRTHRDKTNIRVLMRDQGLRPMVRLMKEGRICLFVPDDFGRGGHPVFTPFFGVQTATLTVVGRLAKLTGAKVVPSAARLDPRTGRYTMTLGDPLENFPSADPTADAAALNRAMETLIRQAPEQYMWAFRWFKTRPDGAPNPYKKR